MNNPNPRFMSLVFSLFLICLILTMFSPKLYIAAASEDSQETTTSFLSDVATLDLSEYSVTLKDEEITYPAEYDGVLQEILDYEIKTTDARCMVHAEYLNGSLDYVMVGWQDGSPKFLFPQSSDAFNYVTSLFERYQVFVGSSHYQHLISMIDLAQASNSSLTDYGLRDQKLPSWIVTSGDYTLKVIQFTPISIDFSWYYSVSGAERPVFSIVLQNGFLYTLSDHTSLFSFSDSPVIVSKDQAIDVAMARTLDFSWTADNQTVTADNVPRELAVAEFQLYNSPSRGSFVYYPFWKVDLLLGKTYPGGVTFIEVGVWADTGEIEYIMEHSGGGGDVDSEVETSPSVTGTPVFEPTPTESPNMPSSNSTLQPSVSVSPAVTPDITTSVTDKPANELASNNQLPLEELFVAVISAITVLAVAVFLVNKRRKQS